MEPKSKKGSKNTRKKGKRKSQVPHSVRPFYSRESKCCQFVLLSATPRVVLLVEELLLISLPATHRPKLIEGLKNDNRNRNGMETLGPPTTSTTINVNA